MHIAQAGLPADTLSEKGLGKEGQVLSKSGSTEPFEASLLLFTTIPLPKCQPPLAALQGGLA